MQSHSQQEDPQAARRAYNQVVSRLADAVELVGTYDIPADLPALTEAEIAAVLKHKPGVLAEVCSDDAVLAALITCLTDGSLTLVTRSQGIGASVLGGLSAQVREYVFEEVQEEVESRLAEASDERAAAASTMTARERMEHECGVAALFRGSHR